MTTDTVVLSDAERIAALPLESQLILTTLATYAKRMAPGQPVKQDILLGQQRLLYHAFYDLINFKGDAFRQTFTEALAIIAQHRKKAFKDTYVFREGQNVRLKPNQVKAFRAFIHMFITLAEPTTRAQFMRQTDLRKCMQFEVTDYGREQVIEYFSIFTGQAAENDVLE